MLSKINIFLVLSLFACFMMQAQAADINLFCTDDFDPVCCDHGNGDWVVTKKNPCLCKQYGGVELYKGKCGADPEPTELPAASPDVE